MARHAARVAALLLALVTLAPAVVVGASPAVAAAPPAFDPGMIMADEVFFAPGTMSAAQVQAFLDQKGASCVTGPTGVVCLKNYRATTVDRPATAQCAAYRGAAGETAAQIIWKTAQACGVNPQVILVILQKEQGLVTASGPALTEGKYRAAMGYRCTAAGSCEAQYAGLSNQVYLAAARFQYYADFPNSFRYRAGQSAVIPYHPNASCGGSTVRIRNQATAGLYNYTPYQPNAAALAAGYGQGDACSSYGNRNFWMKFREWFGPSEGSAYDPVGGIEALTVSGTTMTMTGWALDQDTTAPIYVWITVDGVGRHVYANIPRSDVAEGFPAHGAAHGFSATLTAGPGAHTVCATASNVGPGQHTPLGCRTATVVVGGPPVGNYESATPTQGGVAVKGWALDPDTTAPALVWVTVDGAGRHVVADASRPDIAAAYPGYGAAHGLARTIPAAPGRRQVCLTVVNVGLGSHRGLGCRTVTVPAPPGGSTAGAHLTGGSPVGNLEQVAGTAAGIAVKGWAIDPDTTGPVYMWITVDGVGRHVLANQSRPDVAAAYPAYGPGHGFSTTLAVSAGPHRVCVTASNVGVGSHRQLGCATVSGSGGRLDDVTFQTFTSSAGVPGKYHRFAAQVTSSRSMGLMVHFHGDGAYEFDNPNSSYSLGGTSGLRAQAARRNMILLVARTPDTVGSPTWWEAGSANADYARDLIRTTVLNRYNIDPERIWLVGYSGGAQFITRYFLPKYSSMIGGGGSVVFGGGGTPAVTVQPFASGFTPDFPMYWYTGGADNGTCPGHSYNALADAQRGSAYYRGRGFTTGLETPAGVCHGLSGRFGTVVGQQLDRYDR